VSGGPAPATAPEGDRVWRPADASEVAAGLQERARTGGRVRVRGAGSELPVWPEPADDCTLLSTERLSEVHELDADDGVLHVGAGAAVGRLQEAARAAGLELPLAPPSGRSTVGGVLAAAARGPRALGLGPPRRAVLGLTVVLGSGEVTRCGGRVVKNVTGYDLAKLYVGSHGTLGVIASAWLRLRALPEATRVLAAPLAADEAGVLAALAASRLAASRAVLWADPSRLAVLAGAAHAAGGALPTCPPGAALLVVELAGDAPVVEQDARRLAAAHGAAELPEAVGQALSGVEGMASEPGHAAALRFRVTARPARLAAALAPLRAAGAELVVEPGLQRIQARFAAPEPGADAALEALLEATRAAARAGEVLAVLAAGPPAPPASRRRVRPAAGAVVRGRRRAPVNTGPGQEPGARRAGPRPGESPVRAGPVRQPELYRQSLDCVHCGLCLSSCPTYRETGRETSSPRGRIYLMRGVAEGRIPLGDTVAEEMHLCLGCRACETACPSGVRYGEMLEGMRAEVDRAGLRDGPGRRLERYALRRVLTHPRRLRALVSLLGLAQRLGLDRLGRALAPAGLRERLALAPRVPPGAARAPLPAFTAAEGERRGRVGMLRGCVMPELFGDVSHATVRVLARNGFEVVVPPDQVCCGALHAHAGDAEWAAMLGRRNADAFERAEVDFVVTDSAGCGAALRELGERIGAQGVALAGRVRDVCELLAAEGLRPPAGRIEARVCYDDPCHLLHGQRVGDAPRRLLAAIPGLELVPHDDAAACCGAAGIYNLTHPEMSSAVLARKLAALGAADPDLVATGNPGCIMQLRAGVARAGLRARVLHPVQLLDRAYARVDAPGDAAGRGTAHL